MATISSHYFRECVRGARRHGVNIEALLEAAGIGPAILHEPGARGDVHAMARLVQAIWRALDDEFMGFTDQKAKFGLFGLMTRFIIPCESLGQMLRAGTRFYNLVRDDVHMQLSEQGPEAVLEIRFSRPDLDPAHYFLEFWMVIWHRLAGWMTGGPVPLNWASFTFSRPLSYIEEFKYLFPCPHRFDQARNGFAFDARHLSMPIVRTGAELKSMLADAPLLFMTMPAREDGLARKVRAALLPKEDHAVEFPSIEEVARQFHMTSQTLRRKLKKEAISYGQIKENIRRDIAIQKVVKGNARIEDIARSVGYSETRSFTRAFRIWTGSSPLQYRILFHAKR